MDMITECAGVFSFMCQVYNTLFVMQDQGGSYDSYSVNEDLIQLYINNLWIRIQTDKNVPHRVKLFIEETVLQSTAKEFQSHFRVTREAFDMLLRRVASYLQNNSGTGKPTTDPQKQLLAVLWLLATPDSFRSVGSRFDMGKSSSFQCFERVIRALNNIAPEVITWPHGEEARRVSDGFSLMSGLPGIIGAVDGTYVAIKAPSKSPEVYINRKCFYAVTLQAICNHERRFTDIFTGYPSSVSDIRIFRNSDIYNAVQAQPDRYFNNNQYIIIGDKAYPILPWCVPPYIDYGNLAAVQRNFNKQHSKSRQVIERAFALLFGRMRRLRYLDMNRVDLIPATIVAACVIHNVCLSYNDDQVELYEVEGNNFVQGFENDRNENNQNENNGNGRNEGVVFRNRLAQNLNRLIR